MNELRQPQIRKVLSTTSIVTFLGFLDTHLLIPVIALYAAGLGASIGTIGLIIGVYSITNTPANILFGKLTDRLGCKVPLIVGLSGDALCMFLYSVCRLPIHLALVRAIHGIGGGLIGPATMSLAANYSGRAQKGRTMGFYGMSLAAATLAGYGLSGVFVYRWGYQALFLFGSVLLMAGVIISMFLPGVEKKNDMPTKTSFNEGLNKMKALLRRRGLIIAYCSIFAQYFAFGGVVTLLPLYVKGLGMEAFHVGMLLAIFAIMFIIVQLPSGFISDKVGRLVPTTVGLGLGIVSLVILPFIEILPLLVAIMVLYGIAYGIIFPSISALVVDHTVPEERGLVTGIFHALLTAGVAIGSPLIGWVGQAVGVQLGLVLAPGIMVLALIVALIAMKRIPV